MDAVLFDLDGTLADNEHRSHFVRIKPRNWRAFFLAQDKDSLIEPIGHIVRETYKHGLHKVIIFTARPDDYKEMTEAWLKKHNIPYHAIYMREGKDNRDDEIIKKEMLDKVKQDGYKPIAVFDDRPKVVRMYRREGLLVFPVDRQDVEF